MITAAKSSQYFYYSIFITDIQLYFLWMAIGYLVILPEEPFALLAVCLALEPFLCSGVRR